MINLITAILLALSLTIFLTTIQKKGKPMKRKSKTIEKQFDKVNFLLRPEGNVHECYIEMYKLMNLMYRHMQEVYEKTDD